MKTVLITGAAGDVGSHLRRELPGQYKLRLSDKRPLKPSEGRRLCVPTLQRCLTLC